MNHSQSISSFMQWASERIAKEVEANEAFERRTGKCVALEESTHLPHSLTDQQKRGMIDAVDDLRRTGIASGTACGEVGLHVSTYIQWRKKFGMGRFDDE
jgi:hypothetical protein